jgi:hypothetical protein
MPAVRAIVAGFLIANPLFGSHLPPVRNGPQNHCFSHRNGKILDEGAGKIITLVTALDFFALCAIFDGALPAINKRLLRQTAATVDIFRSQVFQSREISPVNTHETLFEFLVVIPCGL